MKRKVALLASAMLLPMAAMAGNAYQGSVSAEQFSDGSGWARGQMSGTRSSPNPAEEIGCKFATTTTSTGALSYNGMCFATTPAGEIMSCTTSSLSMLQPLQAITDYAYLTFEWNSAGVCKRIEIDVRSSNIP